MGEVYKARDTRLNRTVAIKVLPDHFATDPNLKQRFEREARTVAALNHPHICTLYDIGSQDGVDFLVMEHLEGETLRDRLARGPLRVAEAMPLALTLVATLEVLHAQDSGASGPQAREPVLDGARAQAPRLWARQSCAA